MLLKNCTVAYREPPRDREADWTGPGYYRVPEGNEITFTVDSVPKTMEYDVTIRYETQVRGGWEQATATIERPEAYDPAGRCANSHPSLENQVPFSLPEYDRSVIAMQNVCLEQGKVYKFKIHFARHRSHEDDATAQILIDSVSVHLCRC